MSTSAIRRALGNADLAELWGRWGSKVIIPEHRLLSEAA